MKHIGDSIRCNPLPGLLGYAVYDERGSRGD